MQVTKAFVFMLIVFAPCLLIFAFGVENFHVLISLLYSATAAMILLETFAGIRKKEGYSGCETLEVTAVIPAYLPNEAEGIIETALYFIEECSFLHTIVAYNTPEPMPEVEAALKQLEEATPSFSVLKVEGSTSKAANLNAVLDKELVTTRVLAIFDADHRPLPGSIKKASCWLTHGYSAVQGRCIIRNTEQWLGRLVAAEFDTVYRLLHNSRHNLSGTAIFGGSNGYWLTEVLSRFRFAEVLTEDIDLSLRALAQGVRIAHDPNIISTEESPPTLQALWKQRVRWSQGWLDVTLRLSRKLLCSRHLPFRAKAYWAYNLIYREIFSFLSFSVVFILGSYLLGHQKEPSLLFPVTTAFTLGSIVVCAVVSDFYCKLPWHRFNAKEAISLTIFFTAWKSIVTSMAWTRQLIKDTSWESTRRCIK